ncbi:MAG TPA: hypothetical protein VE961_08215 [Pyrinomonadaceae bacterium]|nr:hypothetical protein [Pyrinomonadaceae bacterium]
MNKWIKISFVFLGGLVAGGVLTLVILGRMSYLDYRDYAMRAARGQVFIAQELRAHRELDLQNRAEANLPQIVLNIHNDKKLQKSAQAPLVMDEIRDFYEFNNVPVPTEISGIIKALPPRNH